MDKYQLRRLLDGYLETVEGFLSHRFGWKPGLRLEQIRSKIGTYVTDVIDDVRLTYNPTTDIGRCLFYQGGFENSELELCRPYISETAVVLDVGANIGLHSLFFSRIANRGMVISMEPSPEVFPLLLRNVEGRRNIIPLNLAASDIGRIAEFCIAEDDAYSSLKDTKRRLIKGLHNVACCCVDDLCNSLRLKALHFVKIDVEGFEHEVIKGMTKTIAAYHPVIFCEIYKGSSSNSNPDATVELINSGGYSAFFIKEGRLESYTVHDDKYYNYIFVPTNGS